MHKNAAIIKYPDDRNSTSTNLKITEKKKKLIPALLQDQIKQARPFVIILDKRSTLRTANISIRNSATA
ncbi:CLUMA_CG017869, isoform A [Clunio marinus]|uniref:CLUMA_CG017869, isoform A n=1 Tax=Clunio marinus TaxID=568069 RepID=A0A1J1IXJ6_9DIPT|nr:CLUMA_CG017869, isoform A [Clunio marinus]